MKIIPLADRVVLKAIQNESAESNSAIYLPESEQKEVPYIYEVIEIWPGTADKPMSVAIWDKVLSGQYSGDEVKIDWENYKIVSTDYILAIIKN